MPTVLLDHHIVYMLKLEDPGLMDLTAAGCADGGPSPRVAGSAHFPSSEVHDPDDAPSVVEGLMQSMLQYRRRLDQQQAPSVSQPNLGPSPTDMHAQPSQQLRPRRSLARHSDVSAVVARSAAVRAESNAGAGVAAPSNAAGECTLMLHASCTA